MRKLLQFLFYIFAAAVLALSLRGLWGNPNISDLQQRYWRDDGPFELSPERGRFGLTYSLIEDKSIYFSTELARFIVPDLGFSNGKYVSLFAPALSFIIAPGYLLGRYLGASQAGVYSVIALFALINLGLIVNISKKLGAESAAAYLAGLTFLFATPAFAYSVDLYQHHVSTFLILLSILILMKAKRVWPLFFVFFLITVSLPLDYPNLILMMPIGVLAVRRLVEIIDTKSEYQLRLPLRNLLVVAGVILPLLFFGWFNLQSYDNPLQLGGTIGGVRAIGADGLPEAIESTIEGQTYTYAKPEEQNKTALGFFNSRRILAGFEILLLGPERGLAVYAPVTLLGLFGAWWLHRQKNKYLSLLVGIASINVVFYSMWGDPWGGWAFGARYLIPAYAILAILLAVALTKMNRRLLFILPFYLLLVYSVAVNTLGAITTSTIPPKQEAVALEKVSGKKERYSWDRNWEFLSLGKLKTLAFNTWASHYVSSIQYYYLLAGSLIVVGTGLTLANYVSKHHN